MWLAHGILDTGPCSAAAHSANCREVFPHLVGVVRSCDYQAEQGFIEARDFEDWRCTCCDT